MKTIDFTQIPDGTRVWDELKQIGGTIEVKLEPACASLPIIVDFDDGSCGRYTVSGRLHDSYRPTLWLNEFEVVIPEKAYHSPLPDLAVDTPVLVRDYEHHNWKKRHFSHFENGWIYTFGHGRTKRTNDGSIHCWIYWKLPEEGDKC